MFGWLINRVAAKMQPVIEAYIDYMLADDRVYKKVMEKMTPLFEEYIQDLATDKEFMLFVNEIIDTIVDRQIKRIQGSAGGNIKAMNAEGSPFSSGNILQMILQYFMMKQGGSQGLNTNPETKPW